VKVNHILIIASLIAPVNAFSGKYDAAIESAKNATLKQSGLEFYIDNAKTYTEKQLERNLKNAGFGEAAGAVGFVAKSLYYKKVVMKYKVFGLEITEGKIQTTLTWKF
jgi:hypothetical protein